MKRLTEKWNGIDGLGYTCADYDVPYVIEKLGKLEDIEEELGIDLVTLFKAVSYSNGSIYVRYKGSITEVYISFTDINAYSGKGLLGNGKPMYFFDLEEGEYFFEDYGRTWALTREELE